MPAPLVISPEMTAIAVMYKQANLIADEVMPRVPVMTESFKYTRYPLSEGFTAPDDTVGRRSAPNQVEFSATEATDTTVDRGLDAPVPGKDIKAWESAKNAGLTSQASPLLRATRQVMSLVAMRREKRVADMVFDTNNYGTNNKATLSGTSQWSDYSNSNPQSAILAALDSMVMRPNVAVFGRAAWTVISQHPKVCLAIFKNNTSAGIVSRQAFADLFELEDVLVGEGWLNTAAKGQTPNMQRIWGKHAAFINRNKEADTEFGVTFGLTAQFGDRIAGTIEDSDIGIHGGVRARAGEQVKELVVANDLGYLFANAVA